ATQPRPRPPTPHIGRHAGRADAGTARPPPPAGRQRPLTAGTLARRLPYQPPSRRLLGRARLPRRLRGGLRLLRLCRARLQPRGTGTARERLLRRLRRLPGRALLQPPQPAGEFAQVRPVRVTLLRRLRRPAPAVEVERLAMPTTVPRRAPAG